MSCKYEFCSNGWIYYQYPIKPAGVSICSSPCPECNKFGTKAAPDEMFITYTEGEENDEDCATSSFSVITPEKL